MPSLTLSSTARAAMRRMSTVSSRGAVDRLSSGPMWKATAVVQQVSHTLPFPRYEGARVASSRQRQHARRQDARPVRVSYSRLPAEPLDALH